MKKHVQVFIPFEKNNPHIEYECNTTILYIVVQVVKKNLNKRLNLLFF